MVGVRALYFLFIIPWHYRPDRGAELFITQESRHMEDTMANTNKLFFTDYHYNIHQRPNPSIAENWQARVHIQMRKPEFWLGLGLLKGLSLVGSDRNSSIFNCQGCALGQIHNWQAWGTVPVPNKSQIQKGKGEFGYWAVRKSARALSTPEC